MLIHLRAAGWEAQVAGDWGTADLEIAGPGPGRAWLTSVYEDVLEQGRHYVCYRVAVRRKIVPALIGLTLLAALVPLPFLNPSLAPLVLPAMASAAMLLRTRHDILRT